MVDDSDLVDQLSRFKAAQYLLPNDERNLFQKDCLKLSNRCSLIDGYSPP